MMKEQKQYIERVKALIQESFPRASSWSKIQRSVQTVLTKFQNMVVHSKNTKIIKLDKGQLYLKSLLKFLSISNQVEKFWFEVWRIIMDDHYGADIQQKVNEQGEIYWDGLCMINVKQSSAKISIASSDNNFQFFINQLDLSESQSESDEEFFLVITKQQVIQYLLNGKEPKPKKQKKEYLLDDKKLFFTLNRNKKEVMLVKKNEDGTMKLNEHDYIFSVDKSQFSQNSLNKKSLKKLVALYQGEKLQWKIAGERKIRESFGYYVQKSNNQIEMCAFQDLVIFKPKQSKSKEMIKQTVFRERVHSRFQENKYVDNEKKKALNNQVDLCDSFKFITEKKEITPKPSKDSRNRQFEIVAKLTIQFTQIVEILRLKKQLSDSLLKKQCQRASQKFYLSLDEFQTIFGSWSDHMKTNGYKI